MSVVRAAGGIAALVAALECVACAAPAADLDHGTLSGVVVDADSSVVAFANVVLRSRRLGTMTDGKGEFRILDVPVGTHIVTLQAIGYERLDISVEVRAGETTKCVLGGSAFRRHPFGLSESAAARESIGVETRDLKGLVTCDIRAVGPFFRVGEVPKFRVRISNKTNRILFLVPSLDGSGGGRYPNAAIEISGSSGEQLIGSRGAMCGNRTDLAESDFVELKPGESLDPFANVWFGYAVHEVRIARPGTYTAVFHYSTNEPDVRKWQGFPGASSLSPVISQRLRRVPLLTISDSTRFKVVD
jgi:hypothetical protein